LWRHDRMSDVPTEWLPYLVSMREAARAVENAADLETARAASNRITEQCQACHAAAGITSNGVGQEGH
jgi:mono/diheme cytochrome c family protein